MTATVTPDNSPAALPAAEYSSFVNRLLASKPHPEVVPADLLLTALLKALTHSKDLDLVKKGLFYGKDNDRLADLRSALSVQSPERAPVYDPDLLPFLHAVVGLRTEVDELLTILLTALAEPLGTRIMERQDVVNDVVDEGGDLLFYLQATLNAVRSSLPEALAGNVAKLRARFPDGFTTQAASNPDKAAEAAAQRAATL